MIEFFFDISSPWTYLAFHNIQPMAIELDVPVHYKPFLVGGIFNSVNPSVYAQRENPVPAKQAYFLKDMQDCARETHIPLVFPPKVFPVNSVKAMRACIWLQQRDAARGEEKFMPFATAAFKAYWADDRDISQDAVLTDICVDIGVDAAALLEGIAQQPIKDQLKANTEEAISRGAFGSPTMFVNGGDMYFGNDRLALVRAAILRNRAGLAAGCG